MKSRLDSRTCKCASGKLGSDFGTFMEHMVPLLALNRV